MNSSFALFPLIYSYSTLTADADVMAVRSAVLRHGLTFWMIEVYSNQDKLLLLPFLLLLLYFNVHLFRAQALAGSLGLLPGHSFFSLSRLFADVGLEIDYHPRLRLPSGLSLWNQMYIVG